MSSPSDDVPVAPVPSVTVDVELSTEVTKAGRIALCLAVAGHLEADETFTAEGPDGPLPLTVLEVPHDTRQHVVDAPVGRLTVRYRATVEASGSTTAPVVTDVDRLTYVLPSRYCPSDRLAGWAAGEFGTDDDAWTLARRVVAWVHERTAYTPGSTDASDDALAPFLSGQGVCRDYAHLVVTVLRALDVPARYVSVYAPGLDPMDGHAVVEVAVDDHWLLVDATHLAPRRSLVRSGTGRDAADVALMTTLGAETDAPFLRVLATADPDLPAEDTTERVALR